LLDNGTGSRVDSFRQEEAGQGYVDFGEVRTVPGACVDDFEIDVINSGVLFGEYRGREPVELNL